MKISSRSSKATAAAILLLLLAAAIVWFTKGEPSVVAYHQSRWNQYAPEIERAIKAQGRADSVSISHIYGMTVSHHIPQTIPVLVKYYSRLKSVESVKRFIVIGPDHINAGQSPITVSNADFFTVYGEVKPIDGLASKLQANDLANIEEAPFDPEHSIGAQMLLISKIFPGAKVTPIILRSDTTSAQASALAKELIKYLDEETVLVASVDFSHYLSTAQAIPMDQISGEVVKKLDLNSVSLVKADSNKSVATFIESMIGKKAYDTADYAVLNTNDLMENSDNTTGYVFGFWGKRRK
jgi:AmmeMemoRadiSam system protein B